MAGMFVFNLKGLFTVLNLWIVTSKASQSSSRNFQPLVINTWPFTNATDSAWQALENGRTGLDAVVAGCSRCERDRCDGSVGYGRHPDEAGETTLDAMIMDGTTSNVGAVGDLRQVRNAIAVARAVMMYTKHTFLVGDQATKFAVEMGFTQEDIHSNVSIKTWNQWLQNNCQPNYRQNVQPNPTLNCGPYKPMQTSDSPHPKSRISLLTRTTKNSLHQNRLHKRKHSRPNIAPNKDSVVNGGTKPYSFRQSRPPIGTGNHDTIGMIVIDHHGNVAGGTSTNGANHKVPGRVGDSPIAGAGAYVDNDVGGAAATGDGDVMMRFLPSFLAVELMRGGKSPRVATRMAIRRISQKYPAFQGALIAANLSAEHGAACHGFPNFTYSLRTSDTKRTVKYTVSCSNYSRT